MKHSTLVTMSCDGCKLSLPAAIIGFENVSECINILQKHGVIADSVKCTTCNNNAVLNSDKLAWICNKRSVNKINKKIKRLKCNFYLSVRTNTWLELSHLPIESVCKFIAYYLIVHPPSRILDGIQETGDGIQDSLRLVQFCKRSFGALVYE